MVQAQINLDKEENKTVNIIKAYYNLPNKEEAIRMIIRAAGKKLKNTIDGEFKF